MNGTEGVKESPCKPAQTRVDKENAAKTSSFLLKKPDSRMGLQTKPSTVQSASNSLYLSKAPEKLAEVYGVKETSSDKTIRATKTTLKLGNGVFGSLTNTDEQTRDLEGERKVKSSAYGSLGRSNSQKNPMPLARVTNKNGTLTYAQQPKDALGNFLVPKVFELNIQGMKPEQVKENVVYSGQKSFGRSFSKGVILSGNQSGAVSACFHDAQLNV